MNSEEQFKESLKNLLDSKEFPFDEGNWEKAQLMRDPEKSKRRIIPFFIAALILITGGILSYFYFSAEKTTAAVAEHFKNPSTAPAVIETTKDLSASQPLHTHNALSANPSHVNSGVNPPPVEPASDLNILAGSAMRTPAKSPHDNAKPEKNNPAVAVVNSPALTTPAINIPGKQEKENATDAEAGKVTKNTPVETVVPELKNQNDQKTDIQAAAENKGKETMPVAMDKAIENKATEKEKNNGEHMTSIDSPDAAVTTPTTLNSTEPLTVITPATSNNPEQPALAKPDSSLSKNDAPAIDMPPANQKINMSFEAGADFLSGWRNPGKTDANGFNPVVGVNYYSYLTDKLAVSLGVQYTAVGNLSYTSHLSKITRYSLGEESAVTVITPEKVQYLSVPIRLHYFVNAKNAFGVGVNIAYLLTVNSKIETYNEKLNVRENYTSSKTQGYTEGFKAFDTQVSVFYRRKLYKNLSVNAEFMYGLTDIKDNAFYNSNVFERNTGVKLTLMYNLFK